LCSRTQRDTAPVEIGQAARQLSIQEQEELLRLNPQHFGEKITIDGRPRQLADLCLLVEEVDGRPIREIIDDIHVPDCPEIVEKTEKKVQQLGLKVRVHAGSQ
jgi:hypothetical protein